MANNWEEKNKDMLQKHGQELQEAIEQNLEGDQQGNSYISKNELEDMLQKHFNRVEEMMKNYQPKEEKKSISERLQERYEHYQEKLNDYGQGFTKSLKKRVTSVKENVQEKMNNMRDKVQDRITDVKSNANKFIQNGVLKLNERVKSFSEGIEQQNNKIKSFSEAIDKRFELNKEQENKPLYLLKYNENGTMEEIKSVNELRQMINKEDSPYRQKNHEIMDDSTFIKEFNTLNGDKAIILQEKDIQQPLVVIQWSENQQLKNGEVIPFGEANERMEKIAIEREKQDGYDKTRYHVVLPKELNENNQVSRIDMNRIDLGDGVYRSPIEQLSFEKNLSKQTMTTLKNEVSTYKENDSSEKQNRQEMDKSNSEKDGKLEVSKDLKKEDKKEQGTQREAKPELALER
ncbi:LPD25 domain-containing protein [Metabacillus fastidiosus]|uniref:LPD25 domain-containing protein n=1 Tax=Metabacillus fastidiosus TaxID=1458 RepID=UPI003D2DFDBD